MRNTIMSVLRRIVVIGAMAGLLVGGASAASKKFQQSFSVSPGGKLTLETDGGSIHIVGTSGSQVSVTADITGREKEVNRFEVTADQHGNDVIVKGKQTKSGSWFFNWSNDLDVEYTIEVPAKYNVHLSTSGGNVNVTSVEGVVSGETSGGNVEMKGVKGQVEFSTSGGNISAEDCAGMVHMETSGGNIAITSITGDVDVSTSGGNVRVSSVNGKVHAETSGGDVVVKVKGDNKGVHAETSGGSIRIELPKTIAANIDAETSGGSVVCDLPVTMSGRIDEGRVKGTVNGGGATIFAHTSGGDVHIKGAE
jgi:DUF4097 and DUF4098 domain-containing protein YvlB